MSRAQRFTFLGIAAVIALVAVVLLAGGGDDTSDSGEQAAATATPSARGEGEAAAGDERSEAGEAQGASPQATETPTPTPTPKPKPPLLQTGKVTKLKATEGDTVRFRVRSDTPEEIHVHAYDIEREVPAGETITVSFKATITGIVEIEFHGSGEQIGELTVESR
jgi:FtsP/CotA-like multicopper oxidase with cupredoxin domain